MIHLLADTRQAGRDFLRWGLVFVILLCLAACQTTQPNPIENGQITPTNGVTATSSPVESTQYSNPTYGFELSHPKGWEVKDTLPGGEIAAYTEYQFTGGILTIFYFWQGENLKTGIERGEGQFRPEGTIQVNGVQLPRQVLIRNDQPVAVYYNGGAAIPTGELQLMIIFVGKDGKSLDMESQRLVDEVVESIHIISTIPTPTPPRLEPVVEKVNFYLGRDLCLDLDSGNIQREGCDLVLMENPALEQGTLLFEPIPPARFNYDAPMAGMPVQEDCLDRVAGMRADAIVIGQNPLNGWCFQTGNGAVGFLSIQQVSETGISMSFLTSYTMAPVVTFEDNDLGITYIMDVTIPDGEIIQTGAPFTKTWRLMNTGTQTWTPSFSLVYDGGELMGAESNFSLGQTVSPGSTIDVSAMLTAPSKPGGYVGYWKLQDESGRRFGVGKYGSEPFYLIIEVLEQVPTRIIGTPEILWGNLKIMAMELTITEANYQGACPMTLDISGWIQTDGVGSFTYVLEAGASTPNFQFVLPPPVLTSNSLWGLQRLDVSFSLDITDSVDGWIHLRAEGPVNHLNSTDIPIHIRCR